VLLATSAIADSLPFLPEKQLAAIASEISGESAKRHLEGFSRHHRMRGSRGFHAASEQIVGMLKQYGFADAHIESLPADGKIFYGTQRSRPAWNADFAELWDGDTRLASWDAAPITLAQDSASADVTTELVDVGNGADEKDYANKDVKGKIVLAAAQPGPVAAVAVAKFGAAGIVSYAQNQKTAWWGEDENLVRWGHLDTFAPFKTFGFMVSLKTARALQKRLGTGETIRLHAIVKAGQEPGAYEIATATIPGSDLAGEEIVFSCHLDHPRPGANDNASGCATILEVARTLSKLVAEKKLEPPRRTIRFVWPAEVEGTLALLNGRPEIARRIKAAIHLDMVGGAPAATKAIFHVTRGPASQPSFIYDIAQDVGELVNEQTDTYASTGVATYPLAAPEGGKEALQASFVPLTLGSDHEVYADSTFGIPAIYLNDWPDRYIHTNFDVPANIDPTKLLRAGFIAAVSGYVLARLDVTRTQAMVEMIQTHGLERAAAARRKGSVNALEFENWYERMMFKSLERFGIQADARPLLVLPQRKEPPRSGPIYRRNMNVKGPMSVFGYDYFADHYPKAKDLKLKDDASYEVLNFADGNRTTSEIRDALSVIYGPIPLEDVEQYLAAAESIGIVSKVNGGQH
jgi:Zn-dependent M28 family amino/carboxypeptidase